jgi:hypothetical protein
MGGVPGMAADGGCGKGREHGWAADAREGRNAAGTASARDVGSRRENLGD